MDSEKRKRFIKVASRRVDKVCQAIISLENCSNTYNYLRVCARRLFLKDEI